MTEAKRMNPEIKARRVAALRSGEYKQGKGKLRSMDDCFCALGVLTDIAAKDAVCAWSVYEGDWISGDPETDIGFSLLFHPVVEWAGLEADLPDLPDGTSIAKLNDAQRKTFAEIADAIESQL